LYFLRLVINRPISASLLKRDRLEWLTLRHVISALHSIRINSPCSWRWANRDHVSKHVWMPGVSEIVGEHSVGLVFFRLTFEPVQTPVCPIDIGFLQVSDEMVPWNIFLVISKLTKKVRNTHTSDESLRVEQSVLELFVTYQIPSGYGSRGPAPLVKMSSVDEFVGNFKVQR